MSNLKFLLLPLFAFVLFSCSEDEVSGPGSKTEIKNWASSDVIDAIEGLGLVIHEGEDPPNIEGSYSLKTRVLQNSNVPNDWSIGTSFFELRFSLSKQNNSALVIDFNATEYDDNGIGTGENIAVDQYESNSFITGSGDNFTAFFKVKESKSGYTATLLYAITGKKTSNGFEAFQQGLVMLDEGGSPSTIFIRNNEGRIFSDQDGTVSKL